jgi:RimJ/RimL family protein N-acetyltransferase
MPRMLPVLNLSEYQDALGRIKGTGGRFLTNFYAAPGQIQTWICRESLFRVPDAAAVILLRRDRRFFHVAHLAAGERALVAALTRLASTVPATLVADLIGKPGDLSEMVSLYRSAGFHPHRSLVRMTKLIPPGWRTAEPDPIVQWAGVADAEEIQAFLERMQDPLVEQTPEVVDVRGWANTRQVLKVRQEGGICGVLIFNTTGIAAVLRYWFVDGRFRNLGFGGKLIRAFFHHCINCQRISLWVITDNDDSIRKYQHFGFHQEDMIDQVVVRPFPEQ